MASSHPSRRLPSRRWRLVDHHHHVMTDDSVVYAPHTGRRLYSSSSLLVISVLTRKWCPMCVVHATGRMMGMMMRMMRMWRGHQHVVRNRGMVVILQS